MGRLLPDAVGRNRPVSYGSRCPGPDSNRQFGIGRKFVEWAVLGEIGPAHVPCGKGAGRGCV
jgi:hypothetical protein